MFLSTKNKKFGSKKFTFLWLLLCLFAIQSGYSKNWYVDNGSNTGDIYTKYKADGITAGIAGNDTTGDGSLDKPYATITKAIGMSANGDIIYIDTGNYSDSFISLSKSIQIIGAGPGSTIFTSNNNHYFIKITVSNVSIKNLITNSYGSNDTTTGQVFEVNGAYSGILFDNVIMASSYGSTSQVYGNLNISGGASVTVQNSLFKCSGFNGSYGGGISIKNSTLFANSTVFFNNDNLANKGGAIDVQGNSTVTVTNCTFDTNTAKDGGAIGIQNTSNVTITGSCFLNNKTEGSSPATNNGGGAIYNSSTNTVNITDCKFSNNCTGIGFNTLPSASGSVATCAPAGNSPQGGAIRQTAGTVNLTRVSFTSNSSSRASSAIDIQKDGGTMNLVDVTFNTINTGNYVNIVNTTGTINFTNSGDPVANGSGVAISKPEITGTATKINTSTPSASPTSNCFPTSKLVSCAVAVNCATDLNAPLIIKCVDNKTINCPNPLPDYRAEVSAYDDCSFTITQSPLPGVVLTAGPHTVTMSVTDANGNISTCTFIVTVVPAPLALQFGDFATAVNINKNGTASFLDTTGSDLTSPKTNYISGIYGGNLFTNTNLGSYSVSSGTLKLTGAEVKTWKNSPGNVCSSTFYWVVYPTGSRPANPTFTSFTLPQKATCGGSSVFTDGFGPCSTNDLKWSTVLQNTDLTAYAAGNYTLETYYSYTGSDTSAVGCDVTQYQNNGCNNFTSTFTLTSSCTNPVITTQPILTQTNCLNSLTPTTISVLATGTTLTYQWYSNTTNSNSGGTLISGQTNASFTPPTNTGGTVYYYCIVYSGLCSVTSTTSAVITTNISAPTGTAAQSFCAINNPTVANLTATGTAVQWYAAATGGSALVSTTALVNGTHYYASQTVTGCESATRFDVTVTIGNPTAPTGTAAQSFCAINTPTVANLTATGTAVQWYAAATGGTALVSTTALVNGTHYYASQTVTGCESATRFDVTVTIGNPTAPTGTAAQSFCAINNPTVASLSATGTAVQWYAVATGGTALVSTTALVNGTHYYASQTVTGCESATRFDVTVTIGNPAAPSGSTPQSFCSINLPTVANLVATGTVINWYTLSTGGTALATSTPLVNGGHYYGSQTVAGCESATRLGVTVTIGNPVAPTGTASQSFCAINNPTVANLAATGTAIQWYATATGGSALASTTAIISGNHYFASQTISGCESATRLDVTVTIGNPSAPTGTAAQSFCAINNPTVASLSATGTAIQWYVAATGGPALASTTALVTGTHYFASQTVTGCESATRFDVTVTIANPTAPGGTATQSFCLNTNPTIANLIATGTAIQWYTLSTGGTPLAPTSSLVNGAHYYASQTVAGCESTARFDVTATVKANDVAIITCGATTPTSVSFDWAAVSGATGYLVSYQVESNPIVNMGNIGNALTFAVNGITDGQGVQITVTPVGVSCPVAAVWDCKSSNCPTPTVDAISDITVCAGDTINQITFNSPQPGVNFTWTSTNANIGLAAVGTGNILSFVSSAVTQQEIAIISVQAVDAICFGPIQKFKITVNPLPLKPIVGTITQPTCSVATGSVQLSGLPSNGNWTVYATPVSGSGSTTLTLNSSGSNATFTGLTASTVYSFSVKNANSCSSGVSTLNSAINSQPITPGAPTTTNPNQSFCTINLPTVANLSTIETTGITWYNSLTSTTPLLLTDALHSGTYYATQTLGVCESTNRLLVNVTVNDPNAPTTTNANQSFCAIDPHTVGNLSTIETTGITWYDSATSTIALALTEELTTGTYYATQKIGTCESATRLAISVIVNDPSAPSTSNANQEFCSINTPTVANLLATGALGSIIKWYNLPTAGTALNSGDALATGTYYATQTVGGCESDTRLAVNVTVHDPNAPTTTDGTQEFCAINLPTVANLSTIETAGITWYNSLISTSPLSLTDALSSGTYYATQTIGSCESILRLAVTVLVNDPNAPTTTNTNQEFCIIDAPTVANLSTIETLGIKWYNSPTSTVALNSTVALSTGTYYASQTIGACESDTRLIVNVIVNDPSAPSTSNANQEFCTINNPTVANLAVSGSDIKWYTISSGGVALNSTDALVSGPYYATQTVGLCESATRLTVNVIVHNPSAPTGNSAQTFCGITNPTIAGLVTTSGTGIVWYDSQSSTSALASDTALINGHIYYATQNENSCESATRFAVTVTIDSPSAPIVGTVTQPTCAIATGSVDLSGLPASGSWTIITTPGNFILTGTGSTTTFSGLVSGTYTFVVTNNGGCSSVDSASAIIDIPLIVPSAPVVDAIVQPTCALATGSVALSGLPVSDTWTITTTPGGFTTTGTGSTTTFSGLVAGTYTFTITNASGCTSGSSATNAAINIQPVTPTAPIVGNITQPTCALATGSVDLSSLPSTGTWTIKTIPGGFTTTGTGTTTTFSGLIAGTYSFTVTNDAGCTSAASATKATINTQPVTPSAPIIGAITQPTCSIATGSVDLSGLPSTGTWTVKTTPGNFIITGTGSTTTFSGLVSGTYTFTVTNDLGCTSINSVNDATIDVPFIVPSAPVVDSIVQPTCALATGSVALSGLPVSDTWTIITTPGGFTTTGTGSTTTFSGLIAGTYTFTVTNASGCTSGSSASSATINIQPVTPTAPIVGNTTQPTCAVATGSVDLSGLPSSGTWTVTTTPGNFTTTGTGTTTTFNGLVSGTYTFTVTNDLGCTSLNSTSAIIDVPLIVPSAPVVDSIVQPTCILATGSVALSGLPTSGTWTIITTPGGFTTTGTGSTTTFSGLVTGTYTFTVTNASGCASGSSATSATINPALEVPTAPIVGSITQPTCAIQTGSVDLSGLPSSGTWTVATIPTGFTAIGTGTTTTFSGLAPGNYTFIVTNASGCTSVASVTSATILVNPKVTPTFTAVAPTCYGEIITPLPTLSIEGYTGTWSPALDNTATKTYTFTPDNTSCYNSTTLEIVVNTLPEVTISYGCNGDDFELNAITTATNVTYEWYNLSNSTVIIGTTSNIILTQEGMYKVVVRSNNCEGFASYDATNIYCGIPKGISPNGDNLNDFFELSNLSVKKLEIFNRYGMKVYSKTNYRNEWDGKTDDGQELPDGTYYYVIEFESGKVKTGWVYKTNERK